MVGLLHPDDPGKAQKAAQRIRLVMRNSPAPPDAPVEFQQRCQVGFTAQQPLPHENQVVILLLRRARQEQPLAEAVDQGMSGGMEEWKSG